MSLLGVRRHAPLPAEGYLPGFDGATGWLNSPPLTVEDLRGKSCALSTQTRFRGPLVAQTSIERLAQPRGGETPMSPPSVSVAVKFTAS